jgi:hypothetical protein
VKYELGFYIPEDGIIHSHRGELATMLAVVPDQPLDLTKEVCQFIFKQSYMVRLGLNSKVVVLRAVNLDNSSLVQFCFASYNEIAVHGRA